MVRLKPYIETKRLGLAPDRRAKAGAHKARLKIRTMLNDIRNFVKGVLT